MGKTFRDYAPDQMLLLPPSLRDWLPQDHEVYFVGDLVDTLDLEPILSSYTEERGFPPYHPVMMTKLIIYGYARGVRSARKMQRACVEDVAFRVLAAGQVPDFRTIAAFRVRHLEALEQLFGQVVHLCRQAGLAKLGHVAVDSTKVRAHASKHRAMSHARMKEEEERLQAEIRRWFEECDEVDAAEDALYGADKTGDELPEELADPKRRLQKIQEAKAALEAEAKAKGKHEPEPKAQRNFTDPDSRIMLSSDKAFIQAYNCLAAVDADSQVILKAHVSQTAPDQGQLLPMIEHVTLEQAQAPEKVSADAGYWKESDIDLLEENDIEAFVAPKRLRRPQWRKMTASRGRLPKDLSRKDRMLRKLCTKRGRAEYRKRETSVEPVFGQIKEALGFRQFLLRGHRKVQGEWSLVCMANNILKLMRAGWIPEEAIS
ncbi:MAG: IS1182 family transposase [Verrucomicrobiota bacterium]|jgi:transposase|nr:IS1182 family transposase [Candidatus Latescibacterota bacterium]MDP7179338.1 IS1182 family transposase [Verrucomicrobiota bacterium]MDP7292825.1 IS1182 family transposase [Verrucomicrobiota bacterium]MEE1569047.1 IS1182 family transposase [Alphaproteobacteria bacterium]|tara:strand:+ start:73 stop:1365 length:1293 start_codon:yes stop_codon:yes gene_type:complete